MRPLCIAYNTIQSCPYNRHWSIIMSIQSCPVYKLWLMRALTTPSDHPTPPICTLLFSPALTGLLLSDIFPSVSLFFFPAVWSLPVACSHRLYLRFCLVLAGVNVSFRWLMRRSLSLILLFHVCVFLFPSALVHLRCGGLRLAAVLLTIRVLIYSASPARVDHISPHLSS